MAIFTGYADGGLNDRDKQISRGVSEDAPLFICEYYRLNPPFGKL